MKITRSWLVAVGATVVVLVISVAMFVNAAQPYRPDGITAQQWVEALCAGDYAALYALSLGADELDRADFEQRVGTYLQSGEVPFPCVGQVNFNLVRDIAVPTYLSGSVDHAVQFSEIVLQGTNDQIAIIPLWTYHEIGGVWRVWSGALGASRQGATAYGSMAQILDSNGLTVGSIQIVPPVESMDMGNSLLVAIPVRLVTLSRVWERFEGQLYAGEAAAQRIDQAYELPEEWRSDFLPPNGGYVPQNFQRSGRLWFRVTKSDAPLTLIFTAQAPYSGVMQSVFLDVPRSEMTTVAPFNPFAAARFVEIDRDNPVFEVQIDTLDMPGDQIRLECSRFVLVTVNDEWKRGTDCTFSDSFEQILRRDERLTVRVTFAGYTLNDPAQFRALTYRRYDDPQLIRYTLWEPS